MNKWYFLSPALLLMLGTPGWIGAQETQPADTKIIIIEERVDKDGNKTVKKIVREGNFSDEEIEQIVAGESRLDQQMTEKPGFLGVMIEHAEAGVRVTEIVEDSPAQKAGLQVGDQITSVGGTAVTSIQGLVDAVSGHTSGEVVEINYLRSGVASVVSATLAERRNAVINDEVFEWDEHIEKQRMHEEEMERHHEEMEQHHKEMERTHEKHMRQQEELEEHIQSEVQRQMNESKDRSDNKPRLGVYLDEVEAGPGVRVTRVSEGSIAESAGLLKGDVITAFNGIPVNSSEDLIQAVKSAPADKKVKVEFIRQGRKIKEKVVFSS